MKQKSLHISGGFFNSLPKSCDSELNGGPEERQQSEIFLKSEVIEILTLSSKKAILTESFLKQKYVVEGLSSGEIAAQTFSSRTTVTRHLKQCGIPLKTFTRRETGKMVYGFRQYSGKAIGVKKEGEVIELIKSYRESGYSYIRIADILNKNKIQTKMKKGIWYSKVVRQIFLRAAST
ncbi:MAG: recombinase family protein [Chryseobacterium sp.]